MKKKLKNSALIFQHLGLQYQIGREVTEKVIEIEQKGCFAGINPFLCGLFFGEVSEWPIEHAWKACLPQGNEGSNPSLSASPSVASAKEGYTLPMSDHTN